MPPVIIKERLRASRRVDAGSSVGKKGVQSPMAVFPIPVVLLKSARGQQPC